MLNIMATLEHELRDAAARVDEEVSRVKPRPAEDLGPLAETTVRMTGTADDASVASVLFMPPWPLDDDEELYAGVLEEHTTVNPPSASRREVPTLEMVESALLDAAARVDDNERSNMCRLWTQEMRAAEVELRTAEDRVRELQKTLRTDAPDVVARTAKVVTAAQELWRAGQRQAVAGKVELQTVMRAHRMETRWSEEQERRRLREVQQVHDNTRKRVENESVQLRKQQLKRMSAIVQQWRELAEVFHDRVERSREAVRKVGRLPSLPANLTADVDGHLRAVQMVMSRARDLDLHNPDAVLSSLTTLVHAVREVQERIAGVDKLLTTDDTGAVPTRSLAQWTAEIKTAVQKVGLAKLDVHRLTRVLEEARAEEAKADGANVLRVMQRVTDAESDLRAAQARQHGLERAVEVLRKQLREAKARDLCRTLQAAVDRHVQWAKMCPALSQACESARASLEGCEKRLDDERRNLHFDVQARTERVTTSEAQRRAESAKKTCTAVRALLTSAQQLRLDVEERLTGHLQEAEGILDRLVRHYGVDEYRAALRRWVTACNSLMHAQGAFVTACVTDDACRRN